MAHLYHYGRRLQQLSEADAPTAPVVPLPGHGSIPEHHAKDFLRTAGIAVPQSGLAPNIVQARAIAARLGYPVALKIQSPDIPHKSDVGGVVLGILTPDGLDSAWEQMETRIAASCPHAKIEGILVERMASPGFEMILGARRDRDWGPIVMVGLGGIWTEALEDVRLFPAGLTADAIAVAPEPHRHENDAPDGHDRQIEDCTAHQPSPLPRPGPRRPWIRARSRPAR